jgi:alpha/beta superfamily hydrolase
VTTEAICLQLSHGDVRVMLHPAEPDRARGTAVLLCPPFGWEEVCSYRGLRTWAAALSAAGYTTARLTLPSTGDSSGEPGDPDRVPAWTAAIAGAADWLRGRGAHRVVAAGIGLGGMLACLATAEGAPIDDLLLWAVAARGRKLMRELRGHHRIIAAAFPEDGGDAAPAGGELELIGYVMSEQTAAAIGELDLTAVALPARGAERRALMLGRDGIAPDAELAAHLRASGAQVESADGRDYARLMDEPQRSEAPARTIALTIEWLERGPRPAPVADRDPDQPAGPLRCHRDGVDLLETPLWLDGVHGRIFAVLTTPAEGDLLPVCAVLLGAGALPHTGPNRGWVELTRGWAARGVPSVRVDFAGVGESDGERLGLEDESFYDPWRDREVQAILDQLQARGLADDFVLGGLCSGAYRSLRRALVDRRVRGLLLVNLAAFLWSRELMAERGRRKAIAQVMPSMRRRSLDRELLAKAVAHARPARAWRLLRRSVERRQRHEVVTALDALRAQGTETLLLLTRREGLLAQLERQGFIDRLGDWPNLTLTRLPSNDHMYRAVWLQRQTYDAMDAAVERVATSLGAALDPTPDSLR